MEAMESPARALAQTLVDRLLAADPFSGSSLGLREYDALVPDPSPEAEQALAADLRGIAAEVAQLAPADPADAVTAAVVATRCANELEALALRAVEFTVSPMPITGAPALLAVLARSVLIDPSAAGDYLERVRGAAGWLDGTTARLAGGAARD